MPEFNTASEEVPEVLTKYRELVDGSLKKCLSSDSLFVYDMLRYCMGWADDSGEPIQGTTGKEAKSSEEVLRKEEKTQVGPKNHFT